MQEYAEQFLCASTLPSPNTEIIQVFIVVPNRSSVVHTMSQQDQHQAWNLQAVRAMLAQALIPKLYFLPALWFMALLWLLKGPAVK